MAKSEGRKNRFNRIHAASFEGKGRRKLGHSIDHKFSSKLQSGNFMMQGTKKTYITRKKTAAAKSKTVAAGEEKSKGSQKASNYFEANRGVVAEKKVIKSGGEHGQDKVKLNVKFTQGR
eukprot:CAMPEP_0170500524 /NCGR_PEP_ID=MMETSP0208-20121228/35172_1 /TAXON_ID=197538 /ORGANISM="Strombidium inclinatum, Strain S3" /LENGTH=118 /DNA_ID=CAMNT_0010778605 /DNA_START=1 /DNA_END=357 /DNA_ORIENTATION=+